jgi:transcriptional regulator GlxA family with amidase domain
MITVSLSAAIAAACGFHKVERMRAAFKARYGTTPSEFRGGKER